MTRLTPVIVSDGQVLPACFVRHGFVYVLLTDTPEYERWAHERYREREVQVYRSPEAVMVGSRKRGMREGKSEAKASAARLMSSTTVTASWFDGEPGPVHFAFACCTGCALANIANQSPARMVTSQSPRLRL